MTIPWIAWFVLLTLIHWTAIYPVDSVVQSSEQLEPDSAAFLLALSHWIAIFPGIELSLSQTAHDSQ